MRDFINLNDYKITESDGKHNTCSRCQQRFTNDELMKVPNMINTYYCEECYNFIINFFR